MSSALFQIPPSAVDELQQCISHYANATISQEDAVCALLWRCVARAHAFTMENKVQDVHLQVQMKVLERLQPFLPYRTNPILVSRVSELATFPAPILLSTGMVSLAAVAHAVKEARSESYKGTIRRLRPTSLLLEECHRRSVSIRGSANSSRAHEISGLSYILSAEEEHCSQEDEALCDLFKSTFCLFSKLSTGVPSATATDISVADIQLDRADGLYVFLEMASAVMREFQSDGELTRYANLIAI